MITPLVLTASLTRVPGTVTSLTPKQYPREQTAPGLTGAEMSAYVSETENGFDPDAIPGLEVWLDASDASTITLSGSVVVSWDSKGALGGSYAAAVEARRPTVSGSAVIFDGNDALESTTGFEITTGQAFTHVWSGNFSSIPTDMVIHRMPFASAPAPRFDTYDNRFRWMSNEANWKSFRTDSSISTNTYYRWILRYNGGDPLDIASFSVTLNGSAEALTASLGGGGSAGEVLGAYDSGGSEGVPGKMSQILFYNRALTDEEVAILDEGLLTKAV